jgi:hypothetical protein
VRSTLIWFVFFLFAAMRSACAADGSWPFLPKETDNPVLDLRDLNEEHAGQTGFVRLSEDGSSFLRGDGTGANVSFALAPPQLALSRDATGGWSRSAGSLSQVTQRWSSRSST